MVLVKHCAFRLTCLSLFAVSALFGACGPFAKPTAQSSPSPNATKPMPSASATRPSDVISPSTPTKTPTPFKEYDHDVILEFQNDNFDYVDFNFAQDGSFWILSAPNRGGKIFHYDGAKLLNVISLQDSIVGVHDIERVDDEIWILSSEAPMTSRETHKVIRVNQASGTAEETLVIPKAIIKGKKGEYEFGSINFFPLPDDSIVLVAMTGIYRLSRINGKLELQPIEGYPSNGKYYGEIQPTINMNVGYVVVGEQKIKISTPLDNLVLRIEGIAPDGSFYVLTHEYSNGEAFSKSAKVNRFLLRHYSESGELLGSANSPMGIPGISPDGSLYQLVAISIQETQLWRLHFSPDLPSK